MRNITAVIDNLFLPHDQRDKRFLDVYAKYEAEFVHLPSSFDISRGLVRDPYATPSELSECLVGDSDAYVYGDGFDYDNDFDDGDSTVLAHMPQALAFCSFNLMALGPKPLSNASGVRTRTLSILLLNPFFFYLVLSAR